MTYKVICSVKDNQVTLTLPPDFKDTNYVTVYIYDHIDSKSAKLELLKLASHDPLFLADVKEISEEFDLIDNEQYES
ncbi:MAG: hypothetical protein ACOYOA_11605 [Saprospiraceae bacterium]